MIEPRPVGLFATNHHDSDKPSSFNAHPVGPFEANDIITDGRDTNQIGADADAHFRDIRQIKFIDPYGACLPQTSYVDHYPKHALPEHDGGYSVPDQGNTPLSDRTEYRDEYPGKEPSPFGRGGRPDDGDGTPMQRKAAFDPSTTYKTHYVPNPLATRPTAPAPDIPDQELDMSGFLDDMYQTHNRVHDGRPGEPREPLGKLKVRDPMPSLQDTTTYTSEYKPKNATSLRLVDRPETPPKGAVFDANTEYNDEFTRKEPRPVMPPLTGITLPGTLQLPSPRRSLGVQYHHRGDDDLFYLLIPATAGAPCSATQIFTTVHDWQEVACIMILYGGSSLAHKNLVLGQLDLRHIPPAPKDIPRIEVTYRLDKELRLSVEVRDLDTARHRLWEQRGDVVTLVPHGAED